MTKLQSRNRRLQKTRYTIKASGRKRLSVHRTLKHIYVQLIDDANHQVLASASTLEKESRITLKGNTGNIKAAEFVGNLIAERAKKLDITEVAFDRSGFKFHGRVKGLAEAARKNGLKF